MCLMYCILMITPFSYFLVFLGYAVYPSFFFFELSLIPRMFSNVFTEKTPWISGCAQFKTLLSKCQLYYDGREYFSSTHFDFTWVNTLPRYTLERKSFTWSTKLHFGFFLQAFYFYLRLKIKIMNSLIFLQLWKKIKRNIVF